jgi:DNA polymerase V
MNHGGKRIGAGRPAGSGKFKGPTKTVRIPMHLEHKIQELADFPSGGTKTIPFYDQRVQAGYPTALLNQDKAMPLDIQSYVAPNPKNIFAVSVSGDSMTDAGLFDGDIMLIDKTKLAKSGDIILASLQDEFTVKRLHVSKNTYMLLPENRNYKPIHVLRKEDLQIWGVVTYVIHRVAQ